MPAVTIPDQFDSDEEEGGNVPRENHIVTQLEREPVKEEDIRCRCTTGCKTSRCKCVKNGAGCPESTCSCASGSNPLNSLAVFSGKAGHRVTPCFKAWLKQNRAAGELEEEALVSELRCLLLGVEEESDLDAWQQGSGDDVFKDGFDDEMAEFARAWMRPGNTAAEKDKLTRTLFRGGLSIRTDGDQTYFYSFSRGYWMQEDCEKHYEICEICEECVDWRGVALQ